MEIILTYLMAAIALTGSIFNARKKRIGFALWSLTNFYFITRNILIGEYAQAGLYIANLCISVYGFISWGTPHYKEQEQFQNQIFIIADGGMVVDVYSDKSTADLTVEILNLDNARQDTDDEDALKETREHIKKISEKYRHIC